MMKRTIIPQRMSDQLLQRFFRRIKNKEVKIKKVSYEFVLRTLTLAS